MNIIFAFLALITGWLCGWLVNYLSDVLPVTRKLSHPICPHCKEPFSWFDYLFIKKCASCHSSRNIRALLIQISFPVASVLIWLFPRPILPFPLAMMILTFFSLVAVIDLEHRVVLDPISIFGAVFGIGVGIFLRWGNTTLGPYLSTLLGGVAGFGIMLVLYLLGKIYIQQMAKKKRLPPDEVALGFGDVNLAGILGLMLGLRAIIPCLFFAILGGGVVSLLIIIGTHITKKYQAFRAIPYAPFLLLAATYLLFS